MRKTPRLKAYFDEIEYCREQEDDVSALAYAEKLVASRRRGKGLVGKGDVAYIGWSVTMKLWNV